MKVGRCGNSRQTIVDYARGKRVLMFDVLANPEPDREWLLRRFTERLYFDIALVADAIGVDPNRELVEAVAAAYPVKFIKLMVGTPETVEWDDAFDLVFIGDSLLTE